MDREAPRHDTLSPLQAYELAERQKQHSAALFRAKIIRLHATLATAGAARPRSNLPAPLRRVWRQACHDFTATKTSDPALILAAYRTIVMQYGIKRIDPRQKSFHRDLREFYRNYVVNVPIPEEQETRAALRALWSAAPSEGGDEEIAYSVLCPLTGRYLMGLDFTVHPRSNTVHFIYGFINPASRSLGLSKCMIALVHEAGERLIASYPRQSSVHSPLVLFEKNNIEDMSLPKLLLDTAGIDIDHPPRRNARLVRSGISQHLRDYVWNQRGGRVIDYTYLQSSIEGVVQVPANLQQQVIALLNGRPLSAADRQAAAQALSQGLRGRVPGCTALRLCAFVPPGTPALPAAQIRRSNEIFQGISVVKAPQQIGSDIYFLAQMDSLAERTRDGMVRLLPGGPSLAAYEAAEQRTKRLLAQVTWRELREGRHRTYRDWLQQKPPGLDG